MEEDGPATKRLKSRLNVAGENNAAGVVNGSEAGNGVRMLSDSSIKTLKRRHGDRDETGVLHRTKAKDMLLEQQKERQEGNGRWLPRTGALRCVTSEDADKDSTISGCADVFCRAIVKREIGGNAYEDDKLA